jgi:hypothetical protein
MFLRSPRVGMYQIQMKKKHSFLAEGRVLIRCKTKSTPQECFQHFAWLMEKLPKPHKKYEREEKLAEDL